LKWNHKAKDFYTKRLLAEEQSDWVGMRVQGNKLNSLAAMGE